MGYIYKITNEINGRSYIGQTSRSYKDRWAEHKRDRFKEPYCNWPLYKMINKVGIENTNWEVIEEFAKKVLEDINPRDSWRAAKDFRMHIAVESARRAFVEAVKIAGGEL